MIDAWLDLPAVWLFLSLLLFYGTAAAVLAWLAFRSPLGERIRRCSGVVAPFFSSVAVLFALLTGFLASDIAERNRQAWRSVNNEASAIASVNTLGLAAASDTTALRAALQAYAETVLADEWPKMAEGLHSSRTGQALRALLRQAADPAIARESGQAVHNTLLGAVMRIRDARADRLALASDRTNDVKWATVLILGLMTQIAIALVHLEKPRAHMAALTVFSLAAIVALGLIALQEQPFKGALRVSPAPLQRAVALIVPPP
ncbi:hypothetical protein A33M_4318 [Rhodovulum sp. PH10]|nr:hypothetical protein A33M_4318 [Rhodovulum sp. PH10]